MIMQDPKYSLNPVMTHRPADRRDAALARAASAAREARDARAAPCWRRCRSAIPTRVFDALSARGLGRHGPARHDRHDADRRARAADRRRADLGARRHGAAARCSASSTSWSRERGMGLIFISHDLQPGLRPSATACIVMYAGTIVEELRGGRTLPTPSHPYTRGLLNCLPKIDATARRRCRSSTATRQWAAMTAAIARVDNLDVVFGDGRLRQRARHQLRRRDRRILRPGRRSRARASRRCCARSPGSRQSVGRDRWSTGSAGHAPRRRAFYRRVQMVFQDPYGSLHPRQTVDRLLARAARHPRLRRRASSASSEALERGRPRTAASASAIRISSPAASASASRSPGR